MSPWVFHLFAALSYSTPVVIGLATAEAIVLSFARAGSYNWRGFIASTADALGREYLVYRYLPVSLATPVVVMAYAHRLMTLPLNGALAFGLLFLGVDFLYYWLHRASHRVRWFWTTHAIHHSSNEFNLGAAYRIGWTGRLNGTGVFFAPLVWLGYPPGAVFAVLSLNLLYQFWLHAAWIPRLGWLEYLFNTPSHHRVHHAANSEYLDANYGGVLILWDRLFGTFVAEREDLPCRYGLVTPLRSNNPFVINAHEYSALGRDLWRARSWRERVFHLFGPPGWRPDRTGRPPHEVPQTSSVAAE